MSIGEVLYHMATSFLTGFTGLTGSSTTDHTDDVASSERTRAEAEGRSFSHELTRIFTNFFNHETRQRLGERRRRGEVQAPRRLLRSRRSSLASLTPLKSLTSPRRIATVCCPCFCLSASSRFRGKRAHATQTGDLGVLRSCGDLQVSHRPQSCPTRLAWERSARRG